MQMPAIEQARNYKAPLDLPPAFCDISLREFRIFVAVSIYMEKNYASFWALVSQKTSRMGARQHASISTAHADSFTESLLSAV